MPRTNPPVPIVTGPVIRNTVGVLFLGQQFVVVCDYMGATPIGVNTGTLTQFLTNWIIACETQWKGTLSPDASINKYLVSEVAVGTTPTLVAPQVGKIGTVAGTSENSILAAVATKYTAVKGQHGRGRFYFGPIPISFTSPAEPDILNAGAITAYNALNTALLLPIVAGGINFNLVVSTRPIAPLTLIGRAGTVASIVQTVLLGTVRRRREGRGR